MKPWTTACPDWEQRIVAGESLIPLAPLFPANAKEALEVFDSLRMVDAGAYMGDVSLPWIREFVAQIFGSYEDATGVRHIQDYFQLISKKNGKSTNAAAIMLTALILNWRHSAEFIILSPTIEIAGNSFKPAADMVRADEALSEMLHVQDHIRTITHRTTGATLKVVAADSNTVGGKKAVGVLVDELWLLGKQPNAEAMLDEATGGLASRPEGFVIYLTTQSDEPPAGIFKKKLEYARKVRDGEVEDNRFLPVLYEYPPSMVEGEAYKDPSTWYIPNPNLGQSVDIPNITRKYKQAQEDGDESMRLFLAKRLNIEIGMNLRGDRWPGADFWQDAQRIRERVTIDQLIEECEVIDFGIDGGGLDDLLGASAVGRRKEAELVIIPEHVDEETGETIPEQERLMKRWVAWEHAWAHPSVMQRRKDIASRLKDFADYGDLTLVNHIGQDVDQLAKIVGKLWRSGLLDRIGLDPNAIGAILDAILAEDVPQEVEEDGKTKAIIVSVNQGYRLAGAIKTTERKLAEGVLIHGPSLMMPWCVGNAKVKVVGNAIVITKQVSGTAKIDPLMARFNAVSLMALNPASKLASQWDFSGVSIGG